MDWTLQFVREAFIDPSLTVDPVQPLEHTRDHRDIKMAVAGPRTARMSGMAVRIIDDLQ